VISRKPDAVILMGGINDFWWGLPINTALANLSHLLLDDGVHANRQGHRLMAELAMSQIGNLFFLKT
jgi:lysophospholipase L1-like esterase